MTLRLMTLLTIIGMAVPAWGARTVGQFSLGMEQGDFQFGFDFDYQKRRSHSFGGYFLYADAEEGTATNTDPGRDGLGFWSIGGDLKVYFGPDDWQLYIAPGLGITQFDGGAADDETTFGTIMKIGSNYEINDKMALGLEYMIFTNWFNDDANGSGFSLTNFTVRYEFQ